MQRADHPRRPVTAIEPAGSGADTASAADVLEDRAVIKRFFHKVVEVKGLLREVSVTAEALETLHRTEGFCGVLPVTAVPPSRRGCSAVMSTERIGTERGSEHRGTSC